MMLSLILYLRTENLTGLAVAIQGGSACGYCAAAFCRWGAPESRTIKC